MTGPSTLAGLPVKMFKTTGAWNTWLVKYAESSPGLWVQLAKKASALRSITYPEALDVALCHGWIDGQKRSYDEDSWLQKFTKRGPSSIWSKINRAKALDLIESGRMQPGGLSAIERAKANGRWEGAYDSYRTSAPPSDLQAALDQSPRAKAFFATLNSVNRYAILFRIQTAKKPETRRRRIDQFVAMLAKHEVIHS